MKGEYKSPNLYSDSFHSSVTAHSGPELARVVPAPDLAQHLAQALLSDHVELTHRSFTSSSVASGFSSFDRAMAVGLARR